MRRAILVVIDSMGVGAMPDADKYEDTFDCNTLGNVAKFNGGLKLPNLEKLGIGNIIDVEGVQKIAKPVGSYGKMTEKSNGKDTTTGHWEMTGLVLEKGFQTYKEFPQELITKFIELTGCKAILGNKPASGTAILDELGAEHIKTGFPIVYTSADSVYQIACDVNTIPLETLYKWCEIARTLLDDGYNVSRVIARPFHVVDGKYQRISKDRRDYSVPPTGKTILNAIEEAGQTVLGVGKIEDIFVKSGLTHAIHTGGNTEGIKVTLSAIKRTLELDKLCIKKDFDKTKAFDQLIFTNLVDTDMLYGHRNDAVGYGKAIEEFDSKLPEMLYYMTEDDLLIITADHGCDPTVAGTDHTREYVPVLMYGKTIEAKDLGTRESFTDIAATIAEWLGINYECVGTSLI